MTVPKDASLSSFGVVGTSYLPSFLGQARVQITPPVNCSVFHDLDVDCAV